MRFLGKLLLRAVIVAPSFWLLCPKNISAQSTPLRYDVVAIHPVGDTTPSFRGVNVAPSRTHVINTLDKIIGYAYGVRPEFVTGGPPWVQTALFDVVAAVDEKDADSLAGLSFVERGPLLRPVLAQRFALKFHWETRLYKVYELIPANNGIKLPPPRFVPKEAEGSMAVAGTAISGNGVGLGRFCDVLNDAFSKTLGYPVIDKTQITGKFDIDLRWNEGTETGNTASRLPSSLFTAMEEQLGLKLHIAKIPTSALVIESVQMPSTN